ncbi:MAG: PilZ domain-containing protein [Thermodesulfobacteriota bacterium]|nr:PilZ domain-containing protein [Thermodesulfobacteriota bacterium]
MAGRRWKGKRYSIQVPISLFLRDEESSQVLSEPQSGTLVDISQGGACLRLPGVFSDGCHLFYAPLDTPGQSLYLEFPSLSNESDKAFVLQLRPVWLDRDFSDKSMPFRMGVAFLEELSKKMLKEVVATGG